MSSSRSPSPPLRPSQVQDSWARGIFSSGSPTKMTTTTKPPSPPAKPATPPSSGSPTATKPPSPPTKPLKSQDSWARGIFSSGSPTTTKLPSPPTKPATPPSSGSPTTTPRKASSTIPCALCKNPSSKKCTRCKNTHYCSVKCQKKDWQFGHRGVCTANSPKDLPVNALASENFLPEKFDLAAKPLVGPPALRGEPQNLTPLRGILKEIVPALPKPNGFLNFSMVNCYVNCIVQCLFSLPLFRTYLLGRVHSKKHGTGAIKERRNCFLCEFERACMRYMESDAPTSLSWIVANVSSLTKSLSCWEQQDAHEFLLGMLSHMELESTEAGRDPIGSDISQLFGGWMCRISECSECKTAETLYERYSVLSVDVTDTTSTLSDSIKSLIAPEQPSDYACSACKKKTKATSRNVFVSYPPNLVIHLKRFMNTTSKKSSLHIDFPEVIDMRPFILPSYAAPSKSDEASLAAARSVNGSHFAYRLVGVVAHMGWAEYGHYVSYAVNSCGGWLMYSDSMCREVPFSEVSAAEAYILFYQQENMELLGVPCFLKDGPLSENAPCLGGCGMYGTKENSYYCSVCYKKYFPNGKK